MAYQQTATRANIEFLKSSAPGICGGRAIKLNYGPQQAPTQLQGRVAPALWADFMSQVHALADRHPYLVKPGGKQYSNWLLAAVVGRSTVRRNIIFIANDLVTCRHLTRQIALNCRSAQVLLLVFSVSALMLGATHSGRQK